MNTQTAAGPSPLLHQAGAFLSNLRNRVEARVAEAIPTRVVDLQPAITAERKTMHSHRGQALSFYEDRSVHGRPLVLLHSVNACASSYEMKPLFDHFRTTRPVYALDLPGFGFSERDARPYTSALYVQAITDFLARVKDKGDAPDVVALSLSCEFVARVAEARKDLVHSLAFVSPTGLASKKRAPTVPESDDVAPRAMPFWGPLAFGVIA